MRMSNKKEFLAGAVVTLGSIYDSQEKLDAIKFSDLEVEKTVLVIVDMVNGFTREGALKSERVEELIPRIVDLSKTCDKYGIGKLAFSDCHTSSSPEFEAYPAHCLAGTGEGEIVEELKELGGYTLIPKNSTNGFLEGKFQIWLRNKPEINTFIVSGDCTDICIQQFAITLKTWFNMQNKKSRIIVPMNVVETYDLGDHGAELVKTRRVINEIKHSLKLLIIERLTNLFDEKICIIN